jgi:Fe2+ transport system protein FeoA
LAELGLTPGVALTVLQTSKGPILVAVRGARVAVGQEMAAAMRVVSNGALA